MNFKFAKTLLMGSVISMGAFGLVACGDDSSSGASDSPNSSSSIVIPEQHDDIIQFSNLGTTPGLTSVKFTGSAVLNFTDTTSSQNLENLQFTNINFQVGKVSASGLSATSATVIVLQPMNFPTENNLVLSQMGVSVDLSDPTFTECGDFSMIVTVSATDGVQNFESSEQIAFTRPTSYCATQESSSSATAEKTEIEMDSYTVDMSTDPSKAISGLSLATGSASGEATADLIITKSAGDITISSGNGTLFAPIANSEIGNDLSDDYEVGFWPEEVNERSAYVSDFKVKRNIIDQTSIPEAIAYAQQIYVAKTSAYNEATGAGFFAFAIVKSEEGLNNNYDITLKVYKAK